MSNRHPWRCVRDGEVTRDEGGALIVGEDANGLPILHVRVDNDHDGVIDHRTLMALVTELALFRNRSPGGG